MATSTPSTEASYTQMDTADVESIGSHCQLPYCHVLDFLPFRCDSCHQTFCLDHRSETAHKCAHAGEWARNRRKNSVGTVTSAVPSAGKPTVLTAQQCSEPKCKTFINTAQNLGVHCQNCNRQYCLKHRFREDHDCKNLIPLGARPVDLVIQTNTEKLKLGFGRLKTWGREKQVEMRPKPKPTSKAAQLVALNALKKTAKGDDKIPVEKRIYLHCEGGGKAKKDRKDLFFSADWPVGKLLDIAANKLVMVNKNNVVETEEEKLWVYHVDSGRIFDFNEKIGQCLASGNTVVLVRGIKPVKKPM